MTGNWRWLGVSKREPAEGSVPPEIPQWGASPSPAALGWEDACGVGLQAHAAQPRGPAVGWTRPGAQARWRAAWSGQRRARLPTRRWVALPHRLASDLLRPGYNSSRFRVKGRSVVPGRPLRTRAVAPPPGAPDTPPGLEAPIHLASAFFAATVLGASGEAGIKFLQAGLEEGWVRTLPAPDSTAGRLDCCPVGFTATLGALLWVGARPHARWMH